MLENFGNRVLQQSREDNIAFEYLELCEFEEPIHRKISRSYISDASQAKSRSNSTQTVSAGLLLAEGVTSGTSLTDR